MKKVYLMKIDVETRLCVPEQVVSDRRAIAH